MTSPIENSGLYLLLEDYGKRFRQGCSATQQEDTPGASAVLPPIQDQPELRVLLKDYPERTQAWLKKNTGLALSSSVRPQVIAEKTSGRLRLLLDDYDPIIRFWELRKERPLRPALTDTLSSSGKLDQHLNNLLINWELSGPVGCRKAGGGSLVVHAVWIILLMLQPRLFPPDPVRYKAPLVTVFKLTAPTKKELAKLTQTSPRQRNNTEFSGPAEKARPLLALPNMKSVPAPANKSDKDEAGSSKPETVLAQETDPDPAPAAVVAEDPEVPGKPLLSAALSPNPGELRPGTPQGRVNRPTELPAPSTPARRVQTPRLVLEDPKEAMPGRAGKLQLGSLRLTARTDEVIESALRKATTEQTSRPAVGDGTAIGLTGGYIPPSPGNTGSNLELLSDPEGIDFRPYLTQILASVRRNWHAVIPESARLGLSRGNVSLQFSISRDGTVPKLVISYSSGVPVLDRAAVAGISASNPFPPLPTDFTGQTVRLQFKFSYNMQ